MDEHRAVRLAGGLGDRGRAGPGEAREGDDPQPGFDQLAAGQLALAQAPTLGGRG